MTRYMKEVGRHLALGSEGWCMHASLADKFEPLELDGLYKLDLICSHGIMRAPYNIFLLKSLFSSSTCLVMMYKCRGLHGGYGFSIIVVELNFMVQREILFLTLVSGHLPGPARQS